MCACNCGVQQVQVNKIFVVAGYKEYTHTNQNIESCHLNTKILRNIRTNQIFITALQYSCSNKPYSHNCMYKSLIHRAGRYQKNDDGTVLISNITV